MEIKLRDYQGTTGKAKVVTIGKLDLYFSYETIVAFRSNGKLVVSENVWNVTTGKHLNAIDGGDKKARLERGQFIEQLQQTLSKTI